MEQGDRKTLSPESNKIGKPPLKKKTGLSDVGNGHLVPNEGKGKSKTKNWKNDYDNNYARALSRWAAHLGLILS